MRLMVAAALLFGLAGCGTGAGADSLELEGKVTQIAASGGGRAYVIELAEGMLPLDVGEARPPLGATGVVVEVPDGVDVPEDAAGRFDTLSAWTIERGEGLRVLGYLP